MKELILHTLLYSILIVIACPVIGWFVNSIIVKLLSFVFNLIDRSGALLLVILNVITIVGVIHHELAHALIAFVTGAKIKKIKLYQWKKGTLGSVTYIPRGPLIFRSLQMSLSSAAPVYLGAVTEIFLVYLWISVSPSVPLMILLAYVIISIAVHMDMSMQDIIVYFKGIPCCFLLTFVIVLMVNYSGLGDSPFVLDCLSLLGGGIK